MKNSQKGLALLIIIIVIAVIGIGGGYYYIHTQKQPEKVLTDKIGKSKDTQTIPTTTPYTLSINDDFDQLEIKKDGIHIKTLLAKDIPVFDTNDLDDGPSKPEKDYRFYPLDHENNPALFDSLRNKIYFDVFNQTTGGNANKTHAIFSYDFSKDKIEFISSSFGTGGVPVAISPDNKYLLTDEGNHGGFCADDGYILISNLSTGKVVTNVNSSFNPGYVTFNTWIDSNHFKYTDSGFLKEEDCIGKATQHQVTATYTIK
jgi:hypothetical protein